MSATALVIRILLTDAPVQAFVGGAVFGVTAPRGQALPYIVVRVEGEDAEYLVAGQGASFDSRVSVSSHAASAAEADAIGEAVKDSLSGVVNRQITDGRSPAAVLGTVTTWKAGADFVDYSQDRSVFRRLMDFRARWRRAS